MTWRTKRKIKATVKKEEQKKNIRLSKYSVVV